MPINILMPALSPTMEKGNLAKWLKKEGDAVKTGDVIAEIETDKATMEYEAVDDGVMAKIVVPEGTSDVPVNQLIAVMAQEGEDVKAAASGSREGRSAAAKPRGDAQPAAKPAAPRRKRGTRGASKTSYPRAKRAAPRRRRGDAAPTNGHGAGPRLLLAAGAPTGQGSRHRSRPHPGTGPHGRVIARDVAAAKAGGGLRAPAAAPVAAPASRPSRRR